MFIDFEFPSRTSQNFQTLSVHNKSIKHLSEISFDETLINEVPIALGVQQHELNYDNRKRITDPVNIA